MVSATDKPASDDHTDRIFTVDVATGAIREIAQPKGPFGGLEVSPDGRLVAFVAARKDGPSPHDLFVLPLQGGVARNLTAGTLDRPVQSFEWARPDRLVASAQDGFHEHLYTIATDGSVRADSGVASNPASIARSANGTLAWVGEDATSPAEIYVRTGKAPARKVTALNATWSDVALVAPEIIRYRSFDGTPIEAALLRPKNAASGPLPLIVLVHGGPTGAWSDRIDGWGQLLAAHGFAVFSPNIRGSTGYGQRFIESNRADWGGDDFRDIMAGLDTLVARGVADPGRLGIGGWSYGGYMAEWAITQTDRFDAAVTGAGMANLISEFGMEGGPAYDRWFFGLPYENAEEFLESSPFMYLKNAKTPTLILQGLEDTTDPPGQSRELYRGLKYYGVPAELVEYPREPHGFRERRHLIDRSERILAWFEKYVK